MPIRCYLPGNTTIQHNTSVYLFFFFNSLKKINSFCSQTALDIRQSVFGGKNIHVATAHEDLAYSSYVHQYSSGKFDNAL